jgi:predicted dehydrogenase
VPRPSSGETTWRIKWESKASPARPTRRREKSLVLIRADYERAKKAVTAPGKPIWLILPMRYEPHYLAMRQMVKEGVVGDVGMLSSQMSYKAGDRPVWMKERASYGSRFCGSASICST